MTLNFDTICRTCMTESQALLCIFNEQSSSANNDIVSMLQSITSIRALKDDGLPENVCIGCLAEINRAFTFKNRSERSENTLRQYISRVNSKSELESKIVTNSPVLSGTTDDEGYEIIEVDEDERSIARTELIVDYKNETENDESSSNLSTNVLDGHKVLIVTSSASLPNPINVIYECHICFDTFNSISMSEQHMAKFHGSENESKNDNGTPDSIVGDLGDLGQRQMKDQNRSNGDFCYGPEHDTIPVVVEVHESTSPVLNDEEILSNEEATKDQEEIVPVIVVTGDETTELKFNCRKCGGKFAKERSLNIHIKLNKCTIKNFECGICKKVFVRKKNLDCHMETHNEPSEHSCKVCSQKFQQAEELAIHIQTEHEPGRKYLCPHCWKGFNVSSSLKDHIRIHNGERPYLCSICGKGFSQSTNLNQHVMRHNKTKPYSCPVCSYSFVSKGELDAHSRKHSGLHPFVCELCGSSFTTSSSLVKHNRIHTGERPYACEYCPMRFAALGTLKNHTRTHSGARPFACGICGRTFSQRSDCLSHQETHTADKSFFCQQCYKSFHKKSGLRNHMKIHRKDDLTRVASNPPGVETISNNDDVKIEYVTEIYAANDD
ncbi:hypothetical protein HA402_010772 [Bradysia odoriphaga]|nr:hypothetical protein HA402_010772 [Bradysia odoriphaga]